MNIKPIIFKWKDTGKDSFIHLGVGAQTIQKTIQNQGIKDLSIVNFQEDQYYVNYNELQMLTIPIVQQHEYEIQKLKEKVFSLQQEIKQLKGEIK